MEEAIDYQAVITGLQIENEMLRYQMRTFLKLRDVLSPILLTLEKVYRRATTDRMSLLIAAMTLYWLVSTALAIYDRMERKP